MTLERERHHRVVTESQLRFPPDLYEQYDPDGNCCEIVIATAYNTLTGKSITVGDLVRMGYPPNRLGGARMVELLNYSRQSELHMNLLALYAL